MRDFVVELRQQLVPEVKNLTAPGISSGSQPLVLWKNRQYRGEPDALRRRRAASSGRTGWHPAPRRPRPWPCPRDPAAAERFEATFARFCSTFPDAFFVSERARVYLDPKQEKKNSPAGC